MPGIIDKYFKADPWKIIEEGFDPSYARLAESVFTLANEYMLVRGYFEEGYSGDSLAGSYLNGVRYKKQLPPHWCKGLPESECFVKNTDDWLYIRITVDGQRLDMAKCKFHDFVRTLDMKSGVLNRSFTWELSNGKLLKLSFQRFAYMNASNAGCQRIAFESVNFDGEIEIDRGNDERFVLPLKKGVSITIDKIAFGEELLGLSYDDLMEKHSERWAEVWETLDIVIDGDIRAQQEIRFCIFSLHQSYRGVSTTPAGIISEADYGRAWWNTEAYILPFYLLNNPKAARKLLELRYHQLPEALARAEEVGCTGALYPLSTIDGTESCTWWEHSQLQIHTSAVIAYGIWHYVHLTDDKNFLYEQGIEMLLQISRYYASRGRYSQSGDFGLYGVMGPDELNMMVNNNFFTNLLVKKAFSYTLSVIDEMKAKSCSKLDEVFREIGLKDCEPGDWRVMADKMRIPFSEKKNVFEQHDGAFDLPRIEIEAISGAELPVEDHWAYDRIFRYDMGRQPDVLLLMFLYSQDYSSEIKRANYEYYEPRCSHESPLSPCIHSALAAEIGNHKKACEYSRFNLEIYSRNFGEGIPVAVFASNWLNVVYGFGGLRSDGGRLVLNPSIPEGWNSYRFSIEYRGAELHVDICRESICLKVCGDSVPVTVFGVEYLICREEAVVIEMPTAFSQLVSGLSEV